MNYVFGHPTLVHCKLQVTEAHPKVAAEIVDVVKAANVPLQWEEAHWLAVQDPEN